MSGGRVSPEKKLRFQNLILEDEECKSWSFINFIWKTNSQILLGTWWWRNYNWTCQPYWRAWKTTATTDHTERSHSYYVFCSNYRNWYTRCRSSLWPLKICWSLQNKCRENTIVTVTGSKREWTEHLSNFKDLSKPIWNEDPCSAFKLSNCHRCSIAFRKRQFLLTFIERLWRSWRSGTPN